MPGGPFGPVRAKEKARPGRRASSVQQRKTDDYTEFGHGVADNYVLAIRPAGV